MVKGPGQMDNQLLPQACVFKIESSQAHKFLRIEKTPDTLGCPYSLSVLSVIYSMLASFERKRSMGFVSLQCPRNGLSRTYPACF